MIARRLASALVTVSLVVAVSACGESRDTPGEAVPVLAKRLDTVDTALVRGDYDRARQALAGIVSATEQAQAAGKISEPNADRILAAVARLVTALPDPQPPAVTPAPSTSPDEENKDDDKKDEEKKDEEGDGHNSGNGPDDGHGN